MEAVKLIIPHHRPLQTIAQIKSKSRCSNCGRHSEVEMVIYFRNAVDVEQKNLRFANGL